MTFAKPWSAAWQLMRPGQWPVLSAQFLLSVMLLSPRATAGGCWINGTAVLVLAVGWFCWVVLLNGGTLAYNSAYDRDIGPVAYLPDPPEPPAWLAAISLGWMISGAVIGSLIIGLAFGLVTGICVVLSVLYSHPATRLKGRPGWDLLVNMVGYGAATTLAGLLVGKAAYLGFAEGACATTGPNLLAFPAVSWPVAQVPVAQQFAEVLGDGRLFLVLGFGLLFGSFYPGTQIYQAREDQQRGDRTLTTALGVRRALAVSLGLGILATLALLFAWQGAERSWTAALPATALILWLIHHARWWQQAPALDDGSHEKRMYRALTLWATVDAAVLIGWLFRS